VKNWLAQALNAVSVWVRSNLVSLIIALTGLAGAYLGASYGSSTQLDLWRREKVYQTQTDILNRRVDLLRSISRTNVAAQRVSILMATIHSYGSILEAQLEQCKKPDLSAQAIAQCAQEIKAPFDVMMANKEISDLQADYFANLQIAAVYFCEKTRLAISELQQQQKNWWDADANKRENVATAMASELACRLDPIGLLNSSPER
jgi:hypothetical protein